MFKMVTEFAGRTGRGLNSESTYLGNRRWIKGQPLNLTDYKAKVRTSVRLLVCLFCFVVDGCSPDVVFQRL